MPVTSNYVVSFIVLWKCVYRDHQIATTFGLSGESFRIQERTFVAQPWLSKVRNGRLISWAVGCYFSFYCLYFSNNKGFCLHSRSSNSSWILIQSSYCVSVHGLEGTTQCVMKLPSGYRRIITKSSRWRYAGNIFVCHNWLSVETWKWFCVYSENREALVTFGIQIYTQKSTTDWRTTNGNITKQTIVDFSVQIEMPEKSETFTAHMT